MITSDEIRTFKEGVGMAAWHTDLWRFTAIIGHDAGHEYTQEKFRELSTLSKALARFDADTLAKIINAATEPAEEAQESAV